MQAAVSVAIGELAPGLKINLDKVPKKYAGLDGTGDRHLRSPRSVWPLSSTRKTVSSS